MKWSYRLILLVVVIAIVMAVVHYLRKPTNKAVVELPHLEDITPAGVVESTGPQVFYKWQDSDGQWHYADKAPEKDPFDTVVVDPNANLIQSVRVPVADAEPAPEAVPAPSAPDAAPMAGPLGSVSQMHDALNKAGEAKVLMENSTDRIDKALEAQ